MEQERLIATLSTIALKIKRYGGDRVAQDIASSYAKQLLEDGKSAATAIEKGVTAGMRIFKNQQLETYYI